MQHSDIIKWMAQIEDSLTRAEIGKKDRDLIVVLRLLYAILTEWEKDAR